MSGKHIEARGRDAYRLLTVSEVAGALRLSRHAVYKKIKSGRYPSIDIAGGGDKPVLRIPLWQMPEPVRSTLVRVLGLDADFEDSEESEEA